MATTLDMAGEWTIGEAAGLQAQLRDALAQAPFDLDLSGVSACDSAGVQLLLATVRSARDHGHALRVTAASAVVRDTLQRYGLGHLVDGAGEGSHEQ